MIKNKFCLLIGGVFAAASLFAPVSALADDNPPSPESEEPCEPDPENWVVRCQGETGGVQEVSISEFRTIPVGTTDHGGQESPELGAGICVLTVGTTCTLGVSGTGSNGAFVPSLEYQLGREGQGFSAGNLILGVCANHPDCAYGVTLTEVGFRPYADGNVPAFVNQVDVKVHLTVCLTTPGGTSCHGL